MIIHFQIVTFKYFSIYDLLIPFSASMDGAQGKNRNDKHGRNTTATNKETTRKE